MVGFDNDNRFLVHLALGSPLLAGAVDAVVAVGIFVADIGHHLMVVDDPVVVDDSAVFVQELIVFAVGRFASISACLALIREVRMILFVRWLFLAVVVGLLFLFPLEAAPALSSRVLTSTDSLLMFLQHIKLILQTIVDPLPLFLRNNRRALLFPIGHIVRILIVLLLTDPHLTQLCPFLGDIHFR